MKTRTGRRYQRFLFRCLVMIHMIQSLTLSLNGIIDSAVAGQFFGGEGLAAMKLAMPVYSMISLFGAWICSGMSIRLAADLETGDKEEAGRSFRCGMTAAFLVSLLMIVTGLLMSGTLSRLFAGEIRDSSLLLQVKQYVQVIFTGAVFIIFQNILSSLTMMEGRGKSIVLSSVVVFITDVIGDVAAVRLNTGIRGIALATIFSYLCSFLVFLPRFGKKNLFFRMRKPGLYADKLRQIIKSGSPMAVRYICAMLTPLLIKTIEEVIAMSREVAELCTSFGIEHKQAMHTGLCLEELGVNAIEHNVKVRHKVHLRVRFIIGEKWLILRLRDDGRPYDLTQAYHLIDPEDPSSHIGLRLVYASAEKVQYSSFLSLNNVCIRLAVLKEAE